MDTSASNVSSTIRNKNRSKSSERDDRRMDSSRQNANEQNGRYKDRSNNDERPRNDRYERRDNRDDRDRGRYYNDDVRERRSNRFAFICF